MVLTMQRSFPIIGDPGAGCSERTDPLAEVTCCRLCHRYEPTAQMCFLDDELAEGVTIGSTLNTILQSEFDMMQLICLDCLAKIDLMRSIQSFFVGKEEEFRGCQREGLVAVDSDCKSELVLDIKVEPVEIQETVEESGMKKAKRKESQVIPKKKKIQCTVCLKKFKRKRGLKCHMLLHTGELPHKCDLCDASFRMRRDLSKHVIGVHEGKTPYECKECNVPLNTRAEYNRHRRTAHPTGHKRVAVLYRCLVCEVPCKNVGEIRNHIATLHQGNYPYLRCPHCPSLQLTCDAHFKVHRYYNHREQGTDERFACDTCGKEFARKVLLQRHVQSVHAEPRTTKSYSCSQCDKTFRLYSSYYAHKNTHTGTKRQACTFCEMTFSQAGPLKNHIRTRHTGETPFACEWCGETFKDSSVFYKHRAKCRKSS